MTNAPDDRMKRVTAAAALGSIRSPLGRWLAANHAAFADMLRTYRPRWEVLAETLAQEKLLSVPDEFWSGDPAVRAPARKRAGRVAKRAWERVHARLRDGQERPQKATQPRASDGGREAASSLLAKSARPDPTEPSTHRQSPTEGAPEGDAEDFPITTFTIRSNKREQ